MGRYIQAKCSNCQMLEPGSLVKINKDFTCPECGRPVDAALNSISNWDKYFLEVCKAVSSKSPCLSRQIGAILVRDKSIVSTGYNGPARGYPHCTGDTCPRHLKGYKSGEGLVECPAAHAEANCISNAARLGVATVGATLYLNTVVPCKDCAITLVNAGIIEVVCIEQKYYHELSARIFFFGNIFIREFKL